MVYVFEVSSTENPDFKRLIHLSADHTFEDFHKIIQNTCNYDQTQLASFFLTDDNWRRKIEICALEAGETDPKQVSMHNTKLRKYLGEAGQKLVYVFDFLNERLFYLELKEKNMKKDLKEPFVAHEKGNAPSQFQEIDYDSGDVETLDLDDSYQSFGDLEDYYEIFGEMDA
jgi:hypothetical protein